MLIRYASAALQLTFLALGIALLHPSKSWANDETNADSRAPGSTPKETIDRLKSAIRYQDPAAVVPFLDWKGTPSASQKLKETESFLHLFDLYAVLPASEISDQPGGNPSDYPEPDVDVAGQLELPTKSLPLLLEKSQKDGEDSTWKVSQSTLEAALELSATSQESLERFLPKGGGFAFLSNRWGGIAIWQWGVSVLALGLSLLIGKVCASAAEFSLKKVAMLAGWPVPTRLLGFTLPLSIIIAGMFLRISLPYLGVGLSARDVLLTTASLVQIAAVTLLLIRTAAKVLELYESSLRRSEKVQLVALIPPLRRVFSALLIVIAFLIALRSLGYDVSALLAGLGVGGLAVALAAQKTVENLFGGLSVVIDQPVRVGDFCRAGDLMGTVEDIGLRSTRIRTLDRTLVTVPNSEFSLLQLENFAARDSIRFITVIGIRYDTSPAQVRLVLHKLRELLTNHSRVLPGPRVRFINFGASALEIEIFCYLSTSDYTEFLGFKEELNLGIMDALAECGTECAFNTSVQYNAPLEALPADRVAKAAEWDSHRPS